MPLLSFLDICEDAEIRERIEQLKTEQESKRLAEAQRRRVRRSQSNNTRYKINLFHFIVGIGIPVHEVNSPF